MDERKTGSFHLTGGAGQSGEASEIAARLRAAASSLRVKSMPLSDFIPLLQKAADTIERQAGYKVMVESLLEIVKVTKRTEEISREFGLDEPTHAGTERHTRNEPDPESGIRISPGSSIPVERGMV